ncbi:MAG: HIT family protein [Nanoarchaeota archaeon]|nr:HIT family protein [Nanoarchaeota archaeon]MBU1269790.1 HIT family protein [Nanoarchaeota archaeon]MBU1604382.1 HIT family protein [Nanoarchaeota archaeon]MBU2443761.1 HIT family protein [Nanoarchaeota archaeon]
MKQELINDKSRVIYEDNIVFSYLVKNPAAKGHILIIPKKPVKSIEELSEEEVAHIFNLANVSATSLFQILGAQGTNIITDEQDGFVINVVARKQDDGLNFLWTPKQVSAPDMDSVTSSISSKITFKEEPKNPPKVDDQPQDKFSDDEENYLLKQLERIP